MSVVLMSKRELNRIDILARLESGRVRLSAKSLERYARTTGTRRGINFWPVVS